MADVLAVISHQSPSFVCGQCLLLLKQWYFLLRVWRQFRWCLISELNHLGQSRNLILNVQMQNPVLYDCQIEISYWGQIFASSSKDHHNVLLNNWSNQKRIVLLPSISISISLPSIFPIYFFELCSAHLLSLLLREGESWLRSSSITLPSLSPYIYQR